MKNDFDEIAFNKTAEWVRGRPWYKASDKKGYQPDLNGLAWYKEKFGKEYATETVSDIEKELAEAGW